MRIDTNNLNGWQVATKTKGLKAKPLVNLLVDRSVLNKFLVDTLEGKEPLGDGAVVCIGESGDVWQQMPKKLLQKYEVKGIDSDGWMLCEPRPDNAVECLEIGVDFMDFETEFTIVGLWGETIGMEKNIQRGKLGDFICRNREDHNDVWIVKQKIFKNTYSIKE